MMVEIGLIIWKTDTIESHQKRPVIKVHSWTKLIPYGSLDPFIIKPHIDTPIKVSSKVHSDTPDSPLSEESYTHPC